MCKFKSLCLLYPILFPLGLCAEHHSPQELMDEANCMRCHAITDFKARKEKVNSFKKLHHQVKVCADNNFAGWFEEDVQSVSSYLNGNYYKFQLKESKLSSGKEALQP